MYSVAHSRVINHGLLSVTKELYQYGYTSLTDILERFESTHELLERYENTAETAIRFKQECLYRYKKNKAFIVENRRYLTDRIFRDKVRSAFRNIEKNREYSLTTGIESLYMCIDFAMNELVDYISKTCRCYKVKRRISGYLELVNAGSGAFDDIKFACDKDTLKGFQGYIKVKSIIRKSCPKLEEHEEWTFVKVKKVDGTFYRL